MEDVDKDTSPAPLSFEERQLLKDWVRLKRMAIYRPVEFLRFMNKAVKHPDRLFSDEVCAMYLIGVIGGFVSSEIRGKTSHSEKIEQIFEDHKHVTDQFVPQDFIGPKRKYG